MNWQIQVQCGWSKLSLCVVSYKRTRFDFIPWYFRREMIIISGKNWGSTCITWDAFGKIFANFKFKALHTYMSYMLRSTLALISCGLLSYEVWNLCYHKIIKDLLIYPVNWEIYFAVLYLLHAVNLLFNL